MDSDPGASPPEPPTEPATPGGPAPPPTPAAAPTLPPTPTPPPAPIPAPAPAPAHAEHRHAPPPLPQLVTELRELVVTYVKQQTFIPIQRLGRYVGFGLLGSLLFGFGVVFLALSGLRALQTETGTTFTGDWSWVPYLIMIFVLALGGALVWLLRTTSNAGKEAQ